MYKFDVEKETKNIINWIRNWFDNESGNAKGVIVGLSGGCDSAVVAKLCCEAIGYDKVYALLMPNNVQPDITDSYNICNLLGIRYDVININSIFHCIINEIQCAANITLSEKAKISLMPRIRMLLLYAAGQTMHYRVAGTSNLSERYVGYCTKWGDTCYDFNPVLEFTKSEIAQIGEYLKLPHEITQKIP